MSEFTVGEALNVVGFGRFQCAMALILGVYLAANAIEVMLIAILGRAFYCHWGISDFQQASLTTVVFLSMGMAASFWGQWADFYGRLPILRLSAIFLLFFGLMNAVAPNINWVLFIRCIVGAYIAASPQAYVAFQEYLPSKSRGRSFVLFTLFWSVGSSVCILLSWVVLPTLGWRWLVFFSTMPIIIFLICSMLTLDTPMFLADADMHDKCMIVLKQISEINNSSLPIGKLMKNPTSTSRCNILDLFSEGRTRLTLQLSFMWFSYGFSYFGIALLTAETFDNNPQKEIKDATCSLNCDFTNEDYKDMLLNSLSEFPGLILFVVLVDFIGRKLTFSISSLLATIAFIVILVNSHDKSLIFGALFICRLTWVSFTQCLFLYTPEAYPTNLRSLATGFATVLARLGAMVTPYVTQVLFRKHQSVAILIYMAISASAFFVSIMLPFETRGSDLAMHGKPMNNNNISKK